MTPSGSLRITIMLDPNLNKQLREKQVEKLRNSQRSVSFSEVINDAIRRGLK